MKPVVYICRKCNEPLIPIKNRAEHKCSRCGSRKLQKWSKQDFKVVLSDMRGQYDIEVLKIADEIYHARVKGYEVEIITKPKRKSKSPRKVKVSRPEQKKKSRKKAPMKPIKPKNSPGCWGDPERYVGDFHCRNKCPDRHSCRQEIEYQEYKKGP